MKIGVPVGCSMIDPGKMRRVLLGFSGGCTQKGLTKMGAVFPEGNPLRMVAGVFSCKHKT